MKKLIVILLLLFSKKYFIAQNESDALRYSQITFGGTARYSSMAGSFGALGGDFSTLSSNPAGIAFFRKNELTLTPALVKQSISSQSGNAGSSMDYTAFNFQNAGFVWVFNPFSDNSETKWRSLSLGFGYNRMADFSGNMNMSVNNAPGSLTDVFLHNANGHASGDLDPFNEGLAYNTFLIDNPKGGDQYTSYFLKNNVTQHKTIQSSGGMGETVISFGGNYSGKLYLGATLGIPHISYSENSSYTEKSGKDSAGMVSSFVLNQNLITSGTGVNFKLGAVYRITDWMRVGAAFHSPVSFSMNDQYTSNMVTNFKDSTIRYSSPNGNYNYKLRVPPRFIGSAGFVIAKKGLLNVDYEVVNYAYPRFSSADAGTFDDPNNYIQKNYRAAQNLRLGGEWRALSFLSLRAGFAYYGNPYRSSINIDASRKSYSAGIGLRERSFYADFAYVLTQYKDNYFLNDPAVTNANPVINSFNTGRMQLTLGFRF
jgi:long-subunit fatty acid transport protein